MERITAAINLLGSVIATMDKICVVGIDNQNKFVGCAEAVHNVSNQLTVYLAEQQAQSAAEEQKEAVNG